MGQWGKIGQMQFFVDNSKAWHPSVKFKPSLKLFCKIVNEKNPFIGLVDLLS